MEYKDVEEFFKTINVESGINYNWMSDDDRGTDKTWSNWALEATHGTNGPHLNQSASEGVPSNELTIYDLMVSPKHGIIVADHRRFQKPEQQRAREAKDPKALSFRSSDIAFLAWQHMCESTETPVNEVIRVDVWSISCSATKDVIAHIQIFRESKKEDVSPGKLSTPFQWTKTTVKLS
ncbi:MAG: hypothetical protein MMC23_002836 [Stictis urceolatum]|nr:hypothetical protein [Stictis urceolata]